MIPFSNFLMASPLTYLEFMTYTQEVEKMIAYFIDKEMIRGEIRLIRLMI